MSIIHIQKRDNPYVQIDKRPLENKALSWKAKGLLCYLLSKPGNWKVCMEDLIENSTDGKDAVYAIINELLEIGHITRKAVRVKGRFASWDYTVFEEPQTTSGKTRNGSTRNGVASSGKPATNNNDSNNNELNNNEIVADATPDSSDSLKQQKKKREKKEADPPDNSHQSFVDAYFRWYEEKAGIRPNVFEADYKSIKNIRKYLTDAKKGDGEKALQSWLYILQNWAKLENFLQKQVKLTQIDSNLANILLQLRAEHEKVAKQTVKNETLTLEQEYELTGGKLNPNYTPPPMPEPRFPLRKP